MISPHSVVEAHIIADAASKVLADGDKSLQSGIFNALAGVHDRDDQLSVISAMGGRGSVSRTTSRVGTSAKPGSQVSRAGVAQHPPVSSGVPVPPSEPFFVWSPMLGRHISVRHPDELQGPDRPRSSALAQAARAISSCSSLPALHIQGEQASEDRLKRKKVKPDHAAHLRRCPIQMGVPDQTTSSYKAACAIPVQKAVDPKWSTDLKRRDWLNAERIKYDNRLAAATPGSFSPELKYLVKHH
eukprot:gb/GFBE01009090.1/.p1 GENE.gb/GFBE01009090.1/~~gb/GFBE01009090.1/.p1  ORF type:complete len:243 (+),score=34.10 gb/GFBE01009090.1/:1-729(+)